MLIGKVCGPASFQEQDGHARLAFRLTTTEQIRKNGQPYIHEEGHIILMDGLNAEKLGHLVTDGNILFLEGSLKTAAFTDQAGVRRYHTYVRVHLAKQVII